MNDNRIRPIEAAAVIISIITIICLTVIPQIYAHRALNRMTGDINRAIDGMDKESITSALREVSETYSSARTLLCLIYPHTVVSDLEFAIESAQAFAESEQTSEGRMLTELCRVRACLSTLSEMETPNLRNIL